VGSRENFRFWTSQILKNIKTFTSYGHAFTALESPVKVIDDSVRYRIAVGYGDYKLCTLKIDRDVNSCRNILFKRHLV